MVGQSDFLMSQCHSLYVLSWSRTSPIPFHIEKVSDMLQTNIMAMKKKYPVDFIPIAFATSFQDAYKIQEEFEKQIKMKKKT